MGTVCAGDQKSFRKGRAAPRARSQSARENGDHSEMMRCACGAVTVCLCVALATSHTLLQHLRLCGDSLCEDQKSFRSLSDAPPARAQSARGAADVSGVMRRASQRVRSVQNSRTYKVSKFSGAKLITDRQTDRQTDRKGKQRGLVEGKSKKIL